jgi:hypothetical protein
MGDGKADGLSGSRDRDAQRDRKPNASGDSDDVAEDRNLSGASTWLTLPDQPADDADSRDANDPNDPNDAKNRQSNR